VKDEQIINRDHAYRLFLSEATSYRCLYQHTTYDNFKNVCLQNKLRLRKLSKKKSYKYDIMQHAIVTEKLH